MKKRAIVCLFLTVVLLAGALTGCGKTDVKNTAPYDENIGALNCESGVLAENDRYQLLWDSDFQCVILYDAQYDRVYSSTPYDFYSEGDTEAAGAAQMYSPLTVTYLSAETGNLRDVHALADSIELGGVATEPIDGGVRVTYSFPEVRIAVALEMVLSDDGLRVSIPKDGIFEDDNLIYEIAVLPYMLAAQNSAESYLFVPSGSGALINTDNRFKAVSYSEAVYGEDAGKPITMVKQLMRQAYLPVLGVKNRENGLIAVVEDGAECARVNATAGSQEIGYSNAYVSFRVRGEESVVYSSMTNNNMEASKYSEITIDADALTVRYIPLDDDVTYNGMAARYRAYLQAGGAMTETVQAVPALSLDLLGATQTRHSFFGVPYMADVATTTFAQAGRIMEDVQKAVGDGNLLVKLSGYGVGGMANTKVGGGFKFTSTAGGKKALAALQKQADQTGATLAMDYELVRFAGSGNGYSPLNDAAFSVSHLKAKERTYQLNTATEDEGGLSWYLLSRGQIAGAADKALNMAKKNGFGAVSYASLSHIAYSDYRDDRYAVKAHMAQDVASVMQAGRDAGMTVIATTANAYAAVAADVITEAPLYSSAFNALDREIPFYELVFQGYKPLTSPAINTATNVNETYLRAVATGMTLQFTLCDTLHDAVRHEADTAYIAARYDRWADTIRTMAEQSAALHKLVGTQPIMSYEESDGLSHTVFANGVEVCVNYTSAPAESPLGTVPAQGFIYR